MEDGIDCRSAEGITVGLIDAMISIARVLAPRLNGELTANVMEALMDLRSDEDINYALYRFPELSKLVSHTKKELELAGMYDQDADYGPGVIAGNVLELIKVISSQRHSGGSISSTLSLFDKLVRFENLTPLTSDPYEWEDVSVITGTPMWQNKRNHSVFSEDGGKTWWSIDGKLF